MNAPSYDVAFQDWEDFWSTHAEAKGYFDGVVIRAGDATFRPRFIDPVRLSQEIRQTLALGEPYVIEENSVVIERITEEGLQAAIDYLAKRSFADLSPSDIGDDDAAQTLARELDAYLDGDMTMGRVGSIEGALSRAEGLSSRLSGFEDLEEAAAMFNPREGSPYLDEAAFERVARMVREEIRREFGA